MRTFNQAVRYFCRAVTGFGNGQYFLPSLLLIVFGFYFAQLPLTLLLPLLAGLGSLSCAVFMARNLYQEKNQAKQFASEQALHSMLKQTMQRIDCELNPQLLEQHDEPFSLARLAKKILNRLHVFFNSAKNMAKVINPWVRLAGVAGISIFFVSNPFVFTGIALAVFGFAAITSLDLHLRQTRERQRKRSAKARYDMLCSLRHAVPAQTDTEIEWKKLSKPHWKVYAICLFTGFINGGYFAFAVASLIAIMFPALPATVLLIGIPLGFTFCAVGLACKNLRDYLHQQNYLDFLQLTRAKLERHFGIVNIASSENHHSALVKNFFSGVGLVNVCGRAFKNSNKFISGVVSIATISLGFVAITHPPIALAMFIAAIAFCSISTYELHYRNKQSQLIKQHEAILNAQQAHIIKALKTASPRTQVEAGTQPFNPARFIQKLRRPARHSKQTPGRFSPADSHETFDLTAALRPRPAKRRYVVEKKLELRQRNAHFPDSLTTPGFHDYAREGCLPWSNPSMGLTGLAVV